MGDLPFDKDSLSVVTGRAIKEKPVSLDSIDAESGKVTVWGDIFAVDSRESWDGSKVILAIHFTDYTSSNVMKVITEKKRRRFTSRWPRGRRCWFGARRLTINTMVKSPSGRMISAW